MSVLWLESVHTSRHPGSSMGAGGSMKSMQMLSSSRYEREDLEAVYGVLVYTADITEDDTQKSL